MLQTVSSVHTQPESEKTNKKRCYYWQEFFSSVPFEIDKRLRFDPGTTKKRWFFLLFRFSPQTVSR